MGSAHRSGKKTAISVMVNGSPLMIEYPMSVTGLLEHLAVLPRKVMVEVNRKVVSRDRFPEVMLNQGDEVELVRFVGGG